MMHLLPAVVALVALCGVAAAQSAPKVPVIKSALAGRVVSITDGDTLRLLTIGEGLVPEQVVIRLEGIDAPESRQAFGTKAKERLGELVQGQQIIVGVTGQDRYGRTLGKIYLHADGRRQEINLQLIAEGLAWHYTAYNAEARYAAAHSEAARDGRGLWSDPASVAPWEFRRR